MLPHDSSKVHELSHVSALEVTRSKSVDNGTDLDILVMKLSSNVHIVHDSRKPTH